jgi:hypothetical protein
MTKGLERATMKIRCNTTLISALLLSLCLMSFIPGGLKCAGAQSSTEDRGLAQPAQSTDANKPEEPLGIEVKHIGTAEAATVVNTGFFPSRQPVIYWHDQDWNIDLVLPVAESRVFSLDIRSKTGRELNVKLPERAMQINSILRAPDDKVIVDTDCNSECIGFVIVDLKLGKVIDDVVTAGTYFSPNRRFILYDNWFANWDDSVKDTYHLYDILRTPKENTCGYEINDPKHERLGDYLRGFQVYPRKPGQIHCAVDEDSDGNVATNFTWAADSSKIVFTDVKRNKTSLVVVTMPVGTKDLPRTSVSTHHRY